MIVTETYIVEDCLIYEDCTTNSVESLFDIPTSVKNQSIYGFNNAGWKYGNNSSYVNMPSAFNLPNDPFELSFIVTEHSRNGLGIFLNNNYYVGTYNANGQLYSYFASETNHGNLKYNNPYYIRVYSDKIEFWDDETLLRTVNATLTATSMFLGTGSSRYVRIKDLKIKPL